MGRIGRVGSGLIIGWLAAGPLAGQAVRARAVDEVTKASVSGALVSLRDRTGRRLAQALTDDGGRVLLKAPGAGSYQLRADRIGYEGLEYGPFELGSTDTLAVTVTMPSRRVMLPDLAVSSRPVVCRLDRETGTQMATLWSEARKALTGAVLTRTDRPPLLEVTLFERDLDRHGRVKSERSSVQRRAGSQPFAAPDPAGLIARGFVEERDGDTWYSAPDANLLLSDEFLEVHCFRVVRGTGVDSGRVGLAFEPAKGRRVPEVSGTLWLDRVTSELRFLEFGYVNLPRGWVSGREGGRIEFDRLPNGGWIVSDWIIRMPVMARIQLSAGFGGERSERDSLLGLRESGGRAAVVAAGAPVRNRAVVAGVVFDSIQGAPLESVVVSLGGGAYVDTTDAAGVYRIETPTQGEYLITFEHPRFAPLGLAPRTGSASLTRGSIATANAAIPPWATIRATVCAGLTIDPDTPTSLVGFIRDSLGAPAPGVELELSWINDRVLSARSIAERGTGATITQRGKRVTIRSDERGAYRVCGVPADTRIVVHAPGGLAPRPDAVRVALDSVQFADISLVPRHQVPPRSAIRVVVRGIGDGQPVGGALVTIPGSTDSTRTDAKGTATLGSLRPGRYRIEGRALGFDVATREATIGDRDTVEVSMGLQPVAQTLAALEVTGAAPRVHAMLAGFEERRKTGLGHYLTRDKLALREHSTLTDVIRMSPGIHMVPLSPCSGHAAANGRDRGGLAPFTCRGIKLPRACYLAVFLDGLRVWDWTSRQPPPDLEQFGVHTLEGVEIYIGPAQLPAQYHSNGANCGAVLLWSRVSG